MTQVPMIRRYEDQKRLCTCASPSGMSDASHLAHIRRIWHTIWCSYIEVFGGLSGFWARIVVVLAFPNMLKHGSAPNLPTWCCRMLGPAPRRRYWWYWRSHGCPASGPPRPRLGVWVKHSFLRFIGISWFSIRNNKSTGNMYIRNLKSNNSQTSFAGCFLQCPAIRVHLTTLDLDRYLEN